MISVSEVASLNSVRNMYEEMRAQTLIGRSFYAYDLVCLLRRTFNLLAPELSYLNPILGGL